MSSVETRQRQMSAAETGHLACFNGRDLSCFNRRDLSCFEKTVLFEQKRSVLFQQNRSSLLEEQKSVLSQQFRLLKPQIRVPAQNHQNGPKWVQNGRQDTRIGQNESYHGSGAFPTGPVAKNPPKKARNPEIGRSGPPLSGSTAQVARLGSCCTHEGVMRNSQGQVAVDV